MQDLLVKMPEWVPREGNVEVLLAESIALEISELITAINRVPGAIVQIQAQLFGIIRSTGTQPAVNLTFNLSDTLGHTVIAGTRVVLTVPGGLEPVIFTTNVDLVVAAGQSVGTVASTGDRFTIEANGIASGTVVELLDAVSFVNSVVTGSVVASGLDAETDTDWIERSVNRFSRLTETLVLPKHFSAAALETPAVVRAITIDSFNSGAGSGVPGDHPGFVTVAVYGNGAVLSAAERATLDAQFEAEAQANLSVSVVDPTITAVTVNVTVQKVSTALTATVQAAVAAALDTYLAPTTWDWSGTVRRNELITLISNVVGVDYVVSLTAPAADVVLSGVAPLADLGTVTVTVANL